ncbi:putative glutathione-specific gamma-glutamylcyclotransferase 2 isoform X2 [Uloborus diversus]|uniref:putative glutathione-specific gamma-glutamylcyclotransferase 2 isoform X2 n=1 Tax=Uloborus diversus TaxID=327109 RepID=UPI00240A2B10|nr:putative glutathione-specific gamma-glutamylcyclotransferase 2 isoform X2 [Uloborus diversus]
MWIFGYGSLMWKTNFPLEEKLIGFIKGYNRRFWQGSEDHRGVPGADRVYGVAYKIAEENVSEVTRYLDFREKDGYQQREVTFYPCKEYLKPIELTIYIGDISNPFYLGPAPLDIIAKQIYESEGPSGRNDDYLFQLAETIRTLIPNIYDEHLFELEKLVKKFKNGKTISEL